MGKRTHIQRAGKGSGAFAPLVMHAKASVAYPEDTGAMVRGQVADFVIDPRHSAPMATILLESGRVFTMMAAEGMQKGQNVYMGEQANIESGNVLPLEKIVEGCPVFAVEKNHNDGGTLVRSSGLYALVISKSDRGVIVKMPSGKNIVLDGKNRATIGCVAGGGRTEKPLVKAGAAYHSFRSRGKKYPSVRGIAMNPVSHPFGGGQHHAGKSKSTSRHAPPGRKVGAIASKRTGRLKK